MASAISTGRRAPTIERSSTKALGSFREFSKLVPKELSANLDFRKKTLKKAQTSRQTRSLLLEMCAADRLFWVNTFIWSHAPKSAAAFGTPVIPFITFECQDEAHDVLGTAIGHEDVHVEKSRQMGGTATVLQSFLHFVLFGDNCSFLLTSRNESMVDGSDKSLFSILDFYLKWLPPWMIGERGTDFDRKKLIFKFHPTGGAMKGESTTENIGVGEDRLACLLDEYAKYENGGWGVLGATADVTNCRIFNSTPQGTAHAFYEMREKTKRRIRLHWSRHPWKNKGLYRADDSADSAVVFRPDDAGILLLDRSFWNPFAIGDGTYRHPILANQLYQFRTGPTKAVEGVRSVWYDRECDRRNEHDIATYLDIDYQGSDYPFFDALKLAELERLSCRLPRYRFMPDYDVEETKLTLQASENGSLLVWCDLDQWRRPPRDRSYVVAADVAYGTGRANSVLSVVDLLTREKVAEFASSDLGQERFAGLAVALAKHFSGPGDRGAKLIWEDQMVVFTKAVISRFQYTNIYHRKIEHGLSNKWTEQPGFHTSNDSKRTLLTNYAEDLYERRFINPSRAAIRECLQYVWTTGQRVEHSAALASQDPSAAGQGHGDRVISDALAALVLREDRMHVEAVEEAEPPWGSWEWMDRSKAKPASRWKHSLYSS